MEEKLKIFFCEDDENLGMLLREYLQAKGYVTDLFSDGEAGYKGFTKGKYDLCVLDVMMRKMVSPWHKKFALSILISLLSSLQPRL